MGITQSLIANILTPPFQPPSHCTIILIQDKFICRVGTSAFVNPTTHPIINDDKIFIEQFLHGAKLHQVLKLMLTHKLELLNHHGA